MKRISIAALGVLPIMALVATGCGKPAPHPENVPHQAAQKLVEPAPKARVTKRKADLKGGVFILMYHRFESGKDMVYRTPADFRKDLERLYKDGFRPVTMSEYIENRMDLPPGASPVVLTFDDATTTQLTLKPDGTPTANCAVGIWMDFAKDHPDFPVHGTFYILPDILWGQRSMSKQKLALLKSLGSELANHTITHPLMSKLSDAAVEREVAECSDRIAAFGADMPPNFALPYGVWPKNRGLLTHGFTYKGKTYRVKSVVLAGSNPARSPNDKKFNPFHLPRIVAYSGRLGVSDWLTQVEKGRYKPYVAP